MAQQVYIVEYTYGSPEIGDRRTTTRYQQDRYEGFMEGLLDLFNEGKISTINAFKLTYIPGMGEKVIETLLYKTKPTTRIQELNTTLV